ncbi:MAG: HNH endonuclease [Candidatus Methanomethylophilaceae archaeon]
MICGFNFEESYGNPGKGFIEVHHNKPVSTFKGELLIDPVQDLTCLCSNCHRMIHRRRNSTLSVEELREYYDKAQEKKRKNQL